MFSYEKSKLIPLGNANCGKACGVLRVTKVPFPEIRSPRSHAAIRLYDHWDAHLTRMGFTHELAAMIKVKCPSFMPTSTVGSVVSLYVSMIIGKPTNLCSFESHCVHINVGTHHVPTSIKVCVYLWNYVPHLYT